MNTAQEILPTITEETIINRVLPVKPKAEKVAKKQSTKTTVRVVKKVKITPQDAKNNLTKILALWVVSVRRFANEVWSSYVAAGYKATGRFMKRIGKFLLSLVSLDSPEKIDLLLEKSKDVAKGAGQQALAAALMALLASLADGARVAMSELIKDGSSKILQAIVGGAAEGFSESSSSSQPNLFRQNNSGSSNYSNSGYSNNRFESNRPPWAT